MYSQVSIEDSDQACWSSAERPRRMDRGSVMEEGRRRQVGVGWDPHPRHKDHSVLGEKGRRFLGFSGPARAQNCVLASGAALGGRRRTEQKGSHHSGLRNG